MDQAEGAHGPPPPPGPTGEEGAMMILLIDAALRLARLRREIRAERRLRPRLDDHLRRDMGLSPRGEAVPARLICPTWN